MQFFVHPLRQMIQQGEGLTLDFKKTISSAKKIAKTLVAFSNTQGGRLLVGVKDNGRVVGTSPAEEMYMLQSAAEVFSKPAIALEFTEHDYRGKQVLEVYVPPSSQKPHYAKGEDGKWWAYIRQEDETRLASVVMLDVLKHRSRQDDTLIEFTEKESALMDLIKSNGQLTLKQATKGLKLPRQEVIKMLVRLISVQVLQVRADKSKEYYSFNPMASTA